MFIRDLIIFKGRNSCHETCFFLLSSFKDVIIKSIRYLTVKKLDLKRFDTCEKNINREIQKYFLMFPWEFVGSVNFCTLFNLFLYLRYCTLEGHLWKVSNNEGGTLDPKCVQNISENIWMTKILNHNVSWLQLSHSRIMPS